MAFDEYLNLRTFLTSNSNKYDLQIANGIFAAKGLLQQEFETEIGRYLIEDKKNFKEEDFANDAEGATQRVNEWISKNTNGKIPQMYEQNLDSQTAVLLASSLYFKGSWNKAFNAIPPEDMDSIEYNAACWPVHFTDTSTCNENVEWMTRTDNYYHSEIQSQDNSLQMDVLEIPFGVGKEIEHNGENYKNRMYYRIWMPKQHDISDPDWDSKYQEFIKQKSGTIRKEGLKNKQMRLTMPKFSIEFDQDIIPLMKQNAINTVFTEDKDFSPMVGDMSDNVEISKINHKVKFDLDEDGVEGAAVTVVEISFRTIQTPDPLVITRPFYFSIVTRCWNTASTRRNDKGCPFGNVPLFTGKVVDPSQ